MNRRPYIVLGWMLFASIALLPCDVRAQGGAVARETGEVILKSLSKYLGKSGTKEIGAELAEFGGEAAVRQLAKKAMQEGGEEAVEQIAKSAGKYGPETIRALQHSDNVLPILKSLDELPEASIETAIRRLAADRTGQELSKNVARYGAKALQAEISHPGVGTSLVTALGDDGIELAGRLTSDEAITLARHAGDIAKLPQAEKAGVLALIRQDTKSMIGFMGRFIEKNPGYTLFAVGTTTVILAEPDRILGGDEVIIDENGIPRLMSKPGLAGRVLDQAGQSIVRPIMWYLAPVVVVMVGGWLSIKVWYAYQSSKLALEKKRAKLDRSDLPSS